MSIAFTPPQPMPAVISRPGAQASYLLLSDTGAAGWTNDPKQATAFPSMREATRMALRLPSYLRAYGLPRGGELTAH
ncbi:hypothetical protein [Phenylobacterium sp.]|uniref:hypothetical protein n=1 Tax=Phenylobacterium sp. TaxID=1871053 RepID=UPI002B8A7A05|nr:hypothetical protein [Phenylobacterium sp.]HLZ75567.1 hypothetical protein [Phenylobacterium sp.]